MTFVTKYLPNYLVGITKLFVKFTNAFLQCMNEPVVKAWFHEYQNLVSKVGIADEPDRFWNCDKTGVQDQFDNGYAAGEVGQPCYRITPGDKGETTTILASFNARGEYGPPLIIFKAK